MADVPSRDGVTSPAALLPMPNDCNKTLGRRHSGGRPRGDWPTQEIVKLASEGHSLRDIARQIGASHVTVKRILSGQRVLV